MNKFTVIVLISTIVTLIVNNVNCVSSTQLATLKKSTIPTSTNYGCIHFGPYVNGYNPNWGPHPSPALMGQLLDKLKQQTKFRCIIVYGVLNTLSSVASLAQQRGFKVILVAWLDSDLNINKQSVTKTIQLAKSYSSTVIGVGCGNEVRLRLGKPQATSIIRDCIGKLRQSGVKQPIGYIDTWHQWCDAPSGCNKNVCNKWSDLSNQVDWIGINNFAFWENVYSPCGACYAIDKVADFHLDRYKLVQKTYANKLVIMTEYGWPSSPNGYKPKNVVTGKVCNSPSSEDNQTKIIRRQLSLLKKNKIPGILFEAFKEPWKNDGGQPSAAYWGICSATAPYTCKNLGTI
jgi:exo-beta-1,3-glucanase (GH17 family)